MAGGFRPSGELERLVAELADGALNDEQERRLAELLRQDPRARACYLDYVAFLTSLHWEYATAASMAGDGLPTCAEPIVPAGVDPPPGPIDHNAGAGERSRHPARRSPQGANLARTVPRAWIRLAVACVLAILVGIIAWRRPGKGPLRPHPAGVAEQERRSPDGKNRPDGATATGAGSRSPRDARAGDEIASMVEARAVVWAEGQVPIAPYARLGPRDIRCTSGTLKLVFDSGALVTLEGPADLKVLSGMRIRAVRGRITARVDDRAKGFAIETPSTLVVDQGTEFGVEIDAAGQTGIVVFEGRVDLSRSESAASRAPIRRLGQGEAMRVGREGGLSRIVSVERRPGDDAWSTGPSADRDAVIRSVRDNLRGLESSKYYRIVHRGLDDDVSAYVDRPHEWNGLDADGMPRFLRGADYIMPFNDDKYTKDLRVTVEMARAATLFIIFDDREQAPAWLSERFADTGVDIGLDEGSWPDKNRALGRGSGQSLDHVFSVWRRDVAQGESIDLGALERGGKMRGMYGIAAVPRS
jgi:hypothetical protein